MCVSIYNIQDLSIHVYYRIYICTAEWQKSSPCCATPYPFKCVGLHVLWSVNTRLKGTDITIYSEYTGKKKQSKTKKKKKKDWNLLKDSHADSAEAPCVSGGSVESFWVCCNSAAAFSLRVRSQQRCLHKCLCVSRFGMSCWLKAFTHRMRVFCV